MKRPYVAGVDTSTQATKILIMDPASGRVVRSGRAPHPEGTEVSPSHWWQACMRAIEQARGLSDVHALSVGGQQHGMVLLDADGEVIRPALLWNDTRSASSAENLLLEAGDGDRERGRAWFVQATGSTPVASLTVTKLRWVADHEPDVVPRIRAICLPHDWLTWRLTGSTNIEDLTTDRSDASGTGYYSLQPPQEYRRDILAAALRLSESEAQRIILPRVAGAEETVGRGDSPHGWGHISLGPGCGDNAGAALALDLQPGEAMVSLGTSGVVAVRSPHPVSDPHAVVTGFSDANDGWLPLACTLNASRIIDAMARIVGADYEAFSALALSVPDAAGLTLVPYFEGERTPNLPDATATLQGMTLANADRAHVARAGVEGLLRHMAHALSVICSLGVDVHTAKLVGGGARLEAVRELAGHVLKTRVEIPAEGEYVALGAAKQAANLR